MDNEIFDYSNDIKFKINLSLNNKNPVRTFLTNICEEIGLIGKKGKTYEKHLKTICANLLLLYLNRRGEFVYYSRNNNAYKNIKRYNPNSISVRRIVRIINLLFENKLINHRKGYHNKYDRKFSYQSRMRPTAKFIKLSKDTFIKRDHIINLDTDVILLKNSKKVLSNFKDNIFTKKIRSECLDFNYGLSKCRISLKKVKEVNNYTKDHNIDYKNKRYYRVFNESFDNGGRFYGPWWLQIPSELRRFILINGNKTVEHDFSSLIIHQLYSEKGLNYFEENTYSNDPYTLKDVPKSERKLNKAIIQIALNCKDFKTLNNALIYEFKSGNLKGNRPKKEEIKRRLKIFCEMNPKISDYIYRTKALKFQFNDSEIARSIINKCTRNLVDILSIHDSFIVENNNSEFLLNAMKSAVIEARFTSIPLIK